MQSQILASLNIGAILILLTGATGFIGTNLVEMLTSCNVRFKAFKERLPLEQDSFDFENIDTVIHLAALAHDYSISPEKIDMVNTKASISLAKLAKSKGVKKFIFLSSTSVYDSKVTKINLNLLPKPESLFGKSKLIVEKALFDLADENFKIVVIRSPLVYGPGVKGNFKALMSLTSKGLPLPFLCINNKKSFVSVKNLCSLIITCIDHSKAKNEVFLVSDDHDISTSDLIRNMAPFLGVTTLQFPIPVWCYNLLGKLLKKSHTIDSLIGSLQVDINHTKEILDWVPIQSLKDGFKETADYMLQQGKK
jgi:UDP-glucose 4-epimerase